MRPARLALLLLAVACTAGPSPGEPPPPAPDTPAASAPSAPSGGGAAPGLSIERVDPDPECDGVFPSRVPEPVRVSLQPSDGAACVGGVSDGTGAVALGLRDASGAVSWRVHAADGTAAGTFEAEAPLLSQPAGWHALAVSRPPLGADPTVDHVAVAPSGEVVRRARVSPDPTVAVGPRWSLSADPAGGSAVAVRSTFVAGNHWSQVVVHRFDAPGAPRWPGGAPALTLDSPREPLFLGAGIPASGDVVVLAQHSAFLDVAWLDPEAGAAGGSVMQEPSRTVAGDGLSHVLDTVALLDGSVAVRADGTWRRVYAPRAAASGPLPAWLAARAASGVRVTRGGRGYALLPAAGGAAAGCATEVELVARSGRTCARITIREAGTACTVRSVDQGWDGTLVVQSAADACTFRWWPGLLAG